MNHVFRAIMNVPAHDVTKYFHHWLAAVLTPLTFATVASLTWPYIFSWWKRVEGVFDVCLMMWATLIVLFINVCTTVLVYGTLTDMNGLDLRLPESVRKLAEKYRDPS